MKCKSLSSCPALAIRQMYWESVWDEDSDVDSGAEGFLPPFWVAGSERRPMSHLETDRSRHLGGADGGIISPPGPSVD